MNFLISEDYEKINIKIAFDIYILNITDIFQSLLYIYIYSGQSNTKFIKVNVMHISMIRRIHTLSKIS